MSSFFVRGRAVEVRGAAAEDDIKADKFEEKASEFEAEISWAFRFFGRGIPYKNASLLLVMVVDASAQELLAGKNL
jgi:hypothetical protein